MEEKFKVNVYNTQFYKNLKKAVYTKEKITKREHLSKYKKLLEYRKQKEVYYTNYKYAANCPRCNTPIEMTYENFCGHCGQKLKWKNVYLYDKFTEKFSEIAHRIEYEKFEKQFHK